MKKQFRISGFSDEIAPEIDAQFAHLNRLGISYFEPRGVDGKNVAELSEREARELKDKMERCGIRASSVGSPIGKIFLNEPFAPHMEALRGVIRTAHILETRQIRVFSFFIPRGVSAGDCRQEVIERLGKMAELAQSEEIVLLHENEKNIYGDTAERCADILNTVRSPAFAAVFDPANFVQCGEETEKAYSLLAPHIQYVHIKDARRDGSVVPAGCGDGRVPELLSALARSGWEGFLSLEPHLGSFAGLEKLEQGGAMQGLAKSGPEKFTLAYEALQTILEGIE